MSVLLVGGTSAALGGVERYCQRFVDAFARHSDVPVRVLPAESAVAGSPAGAYARRMLASLARVRREAAALDPRHDAVWVQYGNAPDLLLAMAVRTVFRGRLLVTAHAGEQWRHLRSGPARRSAAWALRRADRVCALSSAQRALWAGEGIRAEVVPTLLPDWVNGCGKAAGPRRGMLFVGRLSPEKGVGDLLEAFARAAPGERLHVAGTGDPAYVASLRERARALGLGDRVEWHGAVSEQGVGRLMARCRLFVYPSSADAYPLSVLEAFAAGMRVLAYDIPGTAEMLAEFGGAAVRVGDVAGLAAEMEHAMAAGEPDRAGAATLRKRLGWAAVVRRYEAVLGRGAVTGAARVAVGNAPAARMRGRSATEGGSVGHVIPLPDAPAETLSRVDLAGIPAGMLSRIDISSCSFTLSGGLRVDDVSAADAVRACRRRAEAGTAVHVCTVNPEIAITALSDPDYYAAVSAADLITIDGVGISFAVLRQHGRFPARLTGVALMHAMVRDAAAHGREVVIVGATEHSRREAEARLRARGVLVRDGVSPRVARDGSSDSLPEGLIPECGVVLVALGAPKQEMWIRRQIASGAPPAIYVGIGGAVDYLSGVVPTPPRLVRRLGLQWLYRLVTEPRARFKRQLATLPRFLWRQVVRGR